MQDSRSRRIDSRESAVVSPSTIPRELLLRYQRSGPRYTSYPTTLQFRDDFKEAAILDCWRKSNGPHRGLSLYVHIPFCRTRCLYCGCHTTTGADTEAVDVYIKALQAEADSYAGMLDFERPVLQLAVGGGTPTFLRPVQMRRLIEALSRLLHLAPEGERSVEIDPRRVDCAYLDLLIELGFNRFSFGVQDLDQEVQRMVGRQMAEEHLARLLCHLHRRAADAVNLDLIYGLPGQSPESFARTVDRIAALRPSRIAIFGYAHVPWVSPHQRALESYHLPDADERTALFGVACDRLAAAGYVHIGMDHFARPEDELVQALEDGTLTRNFMGYTTQRGLDLLGLGASAISSVGGTYTQNVKEIDEYIRRNGRSKWAKALVLTPEDELRRALILDLFCNLWLDIPALESARGINFFTHFERELQALRLLEQDGLVSISTHSISVTRMGRFFIRNICMCFDEYLSSAEGNGRYSKTI